MDKVVTFFGIAGALGILGASVGAMHEIGDNFFGSETPLSRLTTLLLFVLFALLPLAIAGVKNPNGEPIGSVGRRFVPLAAMALYGFADTMKLEWAGAVVWIICLWFVWLFFGRPVKPDRWHA